MSVLSVCLDFFDIPVELSVNAVDAADARWFFSRHMRQEPTVAPDAELGQDARISVSCSSGFFTSLLAHNRDEKSLSMRDENGSQTVRFTAWSGAPSFLPPFASQSFTRCGAVLHGSAVVALDGRALILLGANYVGKTATTLELLQRGWSLVSDSCVILDYRDRARPVLRRYETPFGFRRATLASWSDRLANVESREQISPVTGKVILAHASDVIAGLQCRDRIPASALVYLGGSSLGENSLDAQAPIVRVYPAGAGDMVSETLEQLPRYTIRNAGHISADLVADELEYLMMGEQSLDTADRER